MAEKETYDVVLDRSIELWTWSRMLMNAFAAWEISSSRFMRPLVSFVRTCTDETTDGWLFFAKADGFPKPSIAHGRTFLQLRPLRFTRQIAASIAVTNATWKHQR